MPVRSSPKRWSAVPHTFAFWRRAARASGISGETVWRVPSLSLPDTSQCAVTQRRCWSSRRRGCSSSGPPPSIRPLTIGQHHVATIANICHRLDGIPLAIELAAARVNVLSVEQIDVRLKDRFRLLTGGSRTSVARQRTLEGTVDWSYDLLSETERRVLCELSVFPGGWSLEAAEEVCSGDGVEKGDVLDLLSHLVDKSLVVVEDDGRGERRYRYLETVQSVRPRPLTAVRRHRAREEPPSRVLLRPGAARRTGARGLRQASWLRTASPRVR